MPLPQTNLVLPFAGSYGAGITFAMVTSPCPASGSVCGVGGGRYCFQEVLSTLTMISCARGYTAVILFASLSSGLVKHS
ncbi:hypothetical protein [Microcoleus sp. herbarium19]|uniref:hypothetical protein n=1 Tax=Microcoleus sp. herbarium19 TaxID=3055440 RepID=UPI002FCEFF84